MPKEILILTETEMAAAVVDWVKKHHPQCNLLPSDTVEFEDVDDGMIFIYRAVIRREAQ